MELDRIRKAVDTLSQYDFGKPTHALFELDGLINASHSDEAARVAIERELAGLLSKAPNLAVTQEVCRRLWRIGTDESLSALQGLIEADEPLLVEAGCYAIGRRPSARADDLLKAALQKASPACREPLAGLVEDRR